MPNPIPDAPLTAEQLGLLQTATNTLSATQLAWVSGYLWALSAAAAKKTDHVANSSSPSHSSPQPAITILAASQTGNARRIAEQLRDDLLRAKLTATLIPAGEFKFKQLAQHPILILIASTQGEGEPPEEAIALHKYLFSKKAPELKNTAFAVLGLGDSSYQYFCQTGKDFDSALASLGAERLLARVDADVEYQAVADSWREQVTALLQQRLPAADNSALEQVAIGNLDSLNPAPWTRENPCRVELTVNQKITGRNSSKDIRHLELELVDPLHYQLGDALGVWFSNDPQLVQQLIALQALDPETKVEVKGQTMSLVNALTSHLELTVNTVNLVKQWAQYANSEALQRIVANQDDNQAYAQRYPVLSMLQQYPARLSAQHFAIFFGR